MSLSIEGSLNDTVHARSGSIDGLQSLRRCLRADQRYRLDLSLVMQGNLTGTVNSASGSVLINTGGSILGDIQAAGDVTVCCWMICRLAHKTRRPGFPGRLPPPAETWMCRCRRTLMGRSPPAGVKSPASNRSTAASTRRSPIVQGTSITCWRPNQSAGPSPPAMATLGRYLPTRTSAAPSPPREAVMASSPASPPPPAPSAGLSLQPAALRAFWAMAFMPEWISPAPSPWTRA